MFDYSENNYQKFGFQRKGDPNNIEWFSERKSKADVWTVDWGRCTRKPKSWKDECIIAAQKIYDSTDMIPNVLFSGGIDSELVVQSFMYANVPFKVSIMRFKNDLNLHDIAFAIYFCEQNNLKYDLIDIDLLEFWDNGLLEYAKKTNCYISYQLCPPMWVVDQIDGLPVLGNGDCYFEKRMSKNYTETYELNQLWDLVMTEAVNSWYGFFIHQNKPGIPKFFQYTPELLYAYLTDSTVQKMVANKIPGKMQVLTLKLDIYNKYFNMIMRPKYTGFEKFEYRYDYLYKEYSNIYRIEYNELLKKIEYV